MRRLGLHQLEAAGTRDSTTYLRGDGQWATPAGGGGSGVASGFYAWVFDGSSVTKGDSATGAASGSNYPSMTTQLELGRAFRVTSITWGVAVAGTYTITIDDELFTTATATGAGPLLFTPAAPVPISPGSHALKLSESASVKMQYVSTLLYRDSWLALRGWDEASGNFHPPVRLTGEAGTFTAF